MEKNKNKHEFTVEIKGKEWEDAIKKAFEKRNKNAKIAGFRPGKAPYDVFVKHYGEASLYFDAADSLLQTAYTKMLKDEKVIPVVEPKADIKDVNKDGITYVFTVITKPEVKVKKYKDLGVKQETSKVTKEEVEEAKKNLLEKYNELVLRDGKVEEGNVVTLDFEGFKDGKPFEGGKGENYNLEIGSHTFIPGFEEQIIGMKSEEEKEIEVTFPEDYGEKSLAGAKATFKVKVHEIKEKVTPELNEEFFEDLGIEGVDSKESLEKHLKEELKEQKDKENENKFIDALLDEIAKNTEVDIPEEMIDDEVHHMIHNMEHQLASQGISMDLYMQYTKTTHDDLHKQFESEAKKNVIYRLILEELLKKETIEITDKEAEKEADEMAKKYNAKKEDILKQVGGLEGIKYDLEMQKLLDKLKEYNK